MELKGKCSHCVSDASLNAALKDARRSLAVNSQRLLTRGIDKADVKAPSVRQALNSVNSYIKEVIVWI
jgi:hypothetical protein